MVALLNTTEIGELNFQEFLDYFEAILQSPDSNANTINNLYLFIHEKFSMVPYEELSTPFLFQFINLINKFIHTNKLSAEQTDFLACQLIQIYKIITATTMATISGYSALTQLDISHLTTLLTHCDAYIKHLQESTAPTAENKIKMVQILTCASDTILAISHRKQLLSKKRKRSERLESLENAENTEKTETANTDPAMLIHTLFFSEDNLHALDEELLKKLIAYGKRKLEILQSLPSSAQNTNEVYFVLHKILLPSLLFATKIVDDHQVVLSLFDEIKKYAKQLTNNFPLSNHELKTSPIEELQTLIEHNLPVIGVSYQHNNSIDQLLTLNKMLTTSYYDLIYKEQKLNINTLYACLNIVYQFLKINDFAHLHDESYHFKNLIFFYKKYEKKFDLKKHSAMTDISTKLCEQIILQSKTRLLPLDASILSKINYIESLLFGANVIITMENDYKNAAKETLNQVEKLLDLLDKEMKESPLNANHRLRLNRLKHQYHATAGSVAYNDNDIKRAHAHYEKELAFAEMTKFNSGYSLRHLARMEIFFSLQASDQNKIHQHAMNAITLSLQSIEQFLAKNLNTKLPGAILFLYRISIFYGLDVLAGLVGEFCTSQDNLRRIYDNINKTLSKNNEIFLSKTKSFTLFSKANCHHVTMTEAQLVSYNKDQLNDLLHKTAVHL